MRVLGIDPGLANLGIGLVEGDAKRAQHLYHICLNTDSAWLMPRRLQYLHAEVSRLIAEYKPDAVAIEDQILRKQADVAFKVGQAFGVVTLACAQAGVSVHTYGPMQVKQALVGTGRADKAQVIYMVRASLGLGSAGSFNNHAADALALALTHLAHQGIQQALTSHVPEGEQFAGSRSAQRAAILAQATAPRRSRNREAEEAAMLLRARQRSGREIKGEK